MTPLHWAAVKGSKPCIRHLVEAGANLFAKEDQGKTPRDMAEELKGLAPYGKGLEEAGYTAEGGKRIGRLSEVSAELSCEGRRLTSHSGTHDWHYLGSRR